VILRLAVRSLLQHPVRAAVLGLGFGLGVSVMATLLGVGEVVLEQSRAPALVGGGQLIVSGVTGGVTSGRFVLDTLSRTAGVTASPRKTAELFLVRGGRVVPVRARAGIPSLERAIGDEETSHVATWADTDADRAWASPDAGAVLRAMDRFHPVPDVPARSTSWAEWLYFKGRAGSIQFYCTFLVGPPEESGRRIAGARLQLDRGGVVTSYAERGDVDEASLLADAPDMTIGRSSVRLDGRQYHVTLNLPGARGTFVIEGMPGRSVAPIEMRGAGGWVSGYTVPVMSGRLSGSLQIGRETIALDGDGYHDHNWGFWESVSWRWGQVQHGDLSFVYGRVFPPADAADPDRVPGFLVVLGPDGPAGYATQVRIRETDNDLTGRPWHIVIDGRGSAIDVRMEVTIDNAIVTKGGALAAGPDFLQLRGTYHVTGTVAGKRVDFEASGAAETFRK